MKYMAYNESLSNFILHSKIQPQNLKVSCNLYLSVLKFLTSPFVFCQVSFQSIYITNNSVYHLKSQYH